MRSLRMTKKTERNRAQWFVLEGSTLIGGPYRIDSDDNGDRWWIVDGDQRHGPFDCYQSAINHLRDGKRVTP